MLEKTIGNYNGPLKDEEAISNPETQQSASAYNRHAEDSAQMTRTSIKCWVKFTTSSTAAPVAIDVSDSTSQWGDGASFAPTISKTATGTYTITYAVEYDDALVGTEGNDAVAETEQVAFRFVEGSAFDPSGPTLGHARGTSVDNVITVYVFDDAGTLSDLSGSGIVDVWAR